MGTASKFTIYNNYVVRMFLLSIFFISISHDLNAQSPLLDSVKASFKKVIGIRNAYEPSVEPSVETSDKPGFIGIAGAYNGSKALSEVEFFYKVRDLWGDRDFEYGGGLTYRSYDAGIHGMRDDIRELKIFFDANVFPFRNKFYTGLRLDILTPASSAISIHPMKEPNKVLHGPMTILLYATAGRTFHLSGKFSLNLFVQPGLRWSYISKGDRDKEMPITFDRFSLVARVGLSVQFRIH